MQSRRNSAPAGAHRCVQPHLLTLLPPAASCMYLWHPLRKLRVFESRKRWPAGSRAAVQGHLHPRTPAAIG
eukprot:scaffold156539_cov26-Tisochrysis_lutea.AAC.6